MKRFFSNILLGVFGLLGFAGMGGSALLEDKPFFQGIVVFASFYLCASCFCTLAKRLAAHLPDEEV